jgi:hypothetical protein
MVVGYWRKMAPVWRGSQSAWDVQIPLKQCTVILSVLKTAVNGGWPRAPLSLSELQYTTESSTERISQLSDSSAIFDILKSIYFTSGSRQAFGDIGEGEMRERIRGGRKGISFWQNKFTWCGQKGVMLGGLVGEIYLSWFWRSLSLSCLTCFHYGRSAEKHMLTGEWEGAFSLEQHTNMSALKMDRDNIMGIHCGVTITQWNNYNTVE